MARVLMIVANTCQYDSRVIKTAETFASNGNTVKLICKHDPILSETDHVNGVEYLRLPMQFSIFYVRGPKLHLSELSRTKATLSSSGLLRKLIKTCGRIILGNAGSNFIKRLPIHEVFDILHGFKPDIVYSHELFTLPEAIRIAKLAGAKVIYDSHELETHRNGLKLLGRMLVYFFEKKYIKHADAVITVSTSISLKLSSLYKIKPPAVILNTPRVYHDYHAKITIRKDLLLEPYIPLAVYVGKLAVYRGLDELVEAMTYCREFHVALLGPSVPGVEEKVVALAVMLGVRERLHIVPSVAPDLVMEYIKSADIGVIPIQDVCLSYRYCMPNKLFEMAFSGIPACVSDLPEMKAFVEREHVGITMDQTDPKDIARAMQELYARRPEFVMTGEQRRALYDKYAWETQAEKLKAVYRQVLGQRELVLEKR